MPNKKVLDKYFEVRDVILFVQHATIPVTADRISEYVTGTAPATTRRLLREMVTGDILVTSKFGRTTTYQLSPSTQSIYGPSHDISTTPV